MNAKDRLIAFGEVPVPHGVVRPLLSDYRRPNDKISEWLSDQTLLTIKRGLYVTNPQLTGRVMSLPLIANALYGPSYVSSDYALSHYGLIPEAVYELTSVTTRRANLYQTPYGAFSYAHLPRDIYRLGIRSIPNAYGHYFLMASPEKALCDKLIQTPHLVINSPKTMLDFLERDLRLDIDEAMKFDHQLLRRIAGVGVKQSLLTTLCRALEM